MRFEAVVVTGGAGLLGSYVVDELRRRCQVTVVDRRPPKNTDVAYVEADIMDYDRLLDVFKGKDAVVNLAAMPNLFSGTPRQIVTVNTIGTWNVFAAAEEAGVRRVVHCSSDSAVGLTLLPQFMTAPRYLPVDEAHPCRPSDPYGLSKALGEQIARSFSARRGVEVVVLRPVFILYPEMYGEVVARARDPENYRGPCAGGPAPAGGGPFWHYVAPEDVAQAFRLALELERVDFATFFVSAETTLAPEPTLERVRALFGKVPEIRRSELYRSNPFAPVFDISNARENLGFTPRRSLRAFVMDRVTSGS